MAHSGVVALMERDEVTASFHGSLRLNAAYCAFDVCVWDLWESGLLRCFLQHDAHCWTSQFYEVISVHKLTLKVRFYSNALRFIYFNLFHTQIDAQWTEWSKVLHSNQEDSRRFLEKSCFIPNSVHLFLLNDEYNLRNLNDICWKNFIVMGQEESDSFCVCIQIQQGHLMSFMEHFGS